MISQLLERLLKPAVVIPSVVATVSIVELAIADRKYGLFTGGFGQSQAVDTPGEMALFFAGFFVTQVLAAMTAWKVAAWFNRRHQGWPYLVNGAFLYVGISAAAMNAQYQLHSYFSDAVGFALIKQLGGGSLKDAILFGKNEIAIGLAAIGSFGLAWWAIWRFLRKTLGTSPSADGIVEGPTWRTICVAVVTALLVLAILPRTGDDAAKGLNRVLSWQALSRIASAGTDFDRDGYGLFGLRIDDAPFDASRHPLALDKPGNGIDEDGYGGDLTLVSIPQARPETLVTGNKLHVVIAVIESARADILGKRIDGKPVAPNLEAIARQGSAITPAFSHVGFTTASLKSIFSGRLVPTSQDPSLFSELRRSGYRISVFSGQPEDFGDISETVNMRRNADIFVDAEKLRDKRAFSFAAQGSLLIDEGILLDEFDRYLGSEQDWASPQFVYVNFQSPHFPYHHDGVPEVFANPPIARSDIAAQNSKAVQRTYYNAVAHADAYLGKLVDKLKATGAWDNTLLLVTGDHGEALFENGFLGHGHVINELQFGTFLVVNRPVKGVRPPIAISDYREIVHDLLSGTRRERAALPPFMHIGELDAPSAIGMAGTKFGIVSLRLDTGLACFERPTLCRDYAQLHGEHKRAIDALAARWGSERWAIYRAPSGD